MAMTKDEYRAWLEAFVSEEDCPSSEDIEKGLAEVDDLREHDPELARRMEDIMQLSLGVIAYARAKVTS